MNLRKIWVNLHYIWAIHKVQNVLYCFAEVISNVKNDIIFDIPINAIHPCTDEYFMFQITKIDRDESRQTRSLVQIHYYRQSFLWPRASLAEEQFSKFKLCIWKLQFVSVLQFKWTMSVCTKKLCVCDWKCANFFYTFYKLKLRCAQFCLKGYLVKTTFTQFCIGWIKTWKNQSDI